MSVAIMSFINCIKSIQFKNDRERYVQLCIENLKNNKSVPQSLLAAQHLIDSFGPASVWPTNSAEDVLQRSIKDTNLIELLV